MRNVPRIRDVEAMLAILDAIGARVELARTQRTGPVCGRAFTTVEVDRELAELLERLVPARGPLLARFHRAVMPPPGGDVIGRRRLDPHLDAFRAMGASAESNGEIVLTPPSGLRPTDVFMDEPSVMATENALMAAALTPGTTVIGNAACEPHVQDLARMLVKMGADIQGIGSNVMTDQRRRAPPRLPPPRRPRPHRDRQLHGPRRRHRRGTAHQGHRPRRPAHDPPRVRARRACARELDGNDVIVPGGQRLVVQADVGEYKSKIQDGPWPAFPADLTSIAVALATQAEGSILVHEWMFENRLIFTDKLILMGADIVLCDPHRAIITGPRRLRGERMESPDIRAGMAMLLAALCAEGRSEIGNVRQIDRGYERIDERLRELGARIERVATEPVRPEGRRH